ncbi:MAG: C4-type zinc ribbon domain-containing protein [Verrucomicrobiia bacterium]
MPLAPASPASILQALIELHEAEAAAAHLKRLSPKARDRINAARALIPLPILGHHDRMRARGRKSVAAVRHGVCTACHIALSGGAWNQLKKSTDLALCENCGSYIYYAEDPAPPPEPLSTTPTKLPSRRLQPPRSSSRQPTRPKTGGRLGKR